MSEAWWKEAVIYQVSLLKYTVPFYTLSNSGLPLVFPGHQR